MPDKSLCHDRGDAAWALVASTFGGSISRFGPNTLWMVWIRRLPSVVICSGFLDDGGRHERALRGRHVGLLTLSVSALMKARIHPSRQADSHNHLLEDELIWTISQIASIASECMAGVSGSALAKRIRMRHSSLRVVFITFRPISPLARFYANNG